MPKYRVKQGKKFGSGGRYPAGTILELTEAEAKGFMDKLEPAPDEALVGSTQEVVPHEELQFKNELGIEVPDDLKIMPSTLPEDEEEIERDADEAPAALPEEEEKDSGSKSTRKSSGKSTRKRSHEG